MAGKQVLCKIPADYIAAANPIYAAITDDAPNAINFRLNFSATGEEPATHAVSNGYASSSPGSSSSDGTKSQWQDWLDNLATYPGADAVSYPATPAIDSLAIAMDLWGLRPVVVEP